MSHDKQYTSLLRCQSSKLHHLSFRLGDHCKFTHPPNADKTQSALNPNANSLLNQENKQQLKRSNEFPTEHEEKEASPVSGGQSDSLTTTNSPKLAKLELEERASVLSENDPGFENQVPNHETSLVDENRKLKENLTMLTKRVEDLSARNRDLQLQNSKLKSAADEIFRSRDFQQGINGNVTFPKVAFNHLDQFYISRSTPDAIDLKPDQIRARSFAA